jgi:Mn-dependent DtxR family transcriptional regulator
MNIMKSSEDYLEMMLMLKEKKGYIRSVDIAAELGVTKPSVSYATKRLRENGYISMNTEGLIELTGSGMEIAKKIYRRHKVIAQFLMSIGVKESIAYEDACKIEHDISPQTFQALKDHIKKDL